MTTLIMATKGTTVRMELENDKTKNVNENKNKENKY